MEAQNEETSIKKEAPRLTKSHEVNNSKIQFLQRKTYQNPMPVSRIRPTPGVIRARINIRKPLQEVPMWRGNHRLHVFSSNCRSTTGNGFNSSSPFRWGSRPKHLDRNVGNVISSHLTFEDGSSHILTRRHAAVTPRNREDVTENEDLNIEYERVHSLGSTRKKLEDEDNNRHPTDCSRGAIKKQFGTQYRDNNQNISHREAGRKQFNHPITSANRNDTNKGGRGRYIGFKYLDDLLKLNEEKFVLKISENVQHLNDYVNKIDFTNDTYVVIIGLLKKIFDSRFPKSQQVLLQIILKERFIDDLQKYLGSLPMHNRIQKSQNQYFWADTDAFWTTLIEVSHRALEILPNYASNVLSKIVSALEVCIPSFEQHQKLPVSEKIKNELNELTEVLKLTIARCENAITASTNSKSRRKCMFDEDEPPDDFRKISVYPDAIEILKGRSFLRPNVIDGPYKNVNHYLDIQFRLLREDFVNPLRSGVRAIKSEEKRRYENVRVHKKVRFLHQETINECYCVRLRFNLSRIPMNFSYEHSKRFMYGALVCFTADKFSTLKFARIVKRDPEDLMKGELVVSFDSPQSDLHFDHDYMMIECSVFFEPYFHVLTALKNIDENNFAMTQYIVNVQTERVPPKYLHDATYYDIDNRTILIHNLGRVAGVLYEFNHSQMEAFVAALTSEFALIQGPPGTGKTYVGLKIAKTLLDNREAWYKSSPMLIICYTNHALDQFLEGLLNTTRNIVRIGGQSKNESLQNLNLTKLRTKKTGPRQSAYKLKIQVDAAFGDLAAVTEAIKTIEQYNGVVSFENFYGIVDDFSAIFSLKYNKTFFTGWLLDGYQQQYFNRMKYNENTNINMYRNSDDQIVRHNNSEKPYCCHDKNEDARYNNPFETFGNIGFRPLKSQITLHEMYRKIMELRSLLDEMQNGREAHKYSEFDKEHTYRMLFGLEEQYKYLDRRLGEVRNAMQNQRIRSNIRGLNPELLPYDDRWALYTLWLSKYRQYLQQQTVVLTAKFRDLYKQYEEVQSLEDTQLLRETLVIGMTTTSAARLRSVLQGIRSPVVIVEEAAEVLEAHIVTALTEDCQHLILIGDHKQLKPSSADYSITRDYKLGVSLFERMVINGVQCHTLNVQHRMRPEFSRLICPMIYRDLKDHESVFNRPSIAGIDSPIYFIDHTHLEDDCDDDPTKKNSHEAKLAVALARHLVLNGYHPENITILAAYLGQMFLMRKIRDKYENVVKDVRIAALDNYQGEENDIIILSLVRSNTEDKIGFLATENRVCVALSRAKNGFYIIGNMGLLSTNSKLWKNIKKILETHNSIGPELTLRCVVHSDTITLVSKGEDFQKISEGGCSEICGAELVCGHLCRSLCHTQNREHEEHKCLESCRKKLCDKDENHICVKKCYEQCGPCTYQVLKKLECGHEVSLACDDNDCPVLVSTKLACNHIVDKPCHADADSFMCPMACEITVDPCGHSCLKKCHVRHDPDHLKYICMKRCSRPRVGCRMEGDFAEHMCPKLCHEPCEPCNVRVDKQRTKCTHMYKIECSIDVESIECKKPCTKHLSCGHQCKKKCYEPCDPSSCLVKVKKKLELCGHEVETPCSMEPNPQHCDKECPLTLDCGHRCTQRCNQECTTQCKVLVDSHVEGACGHVITKMECHDSTSGLEKKDRKLLASCSEPCNVKLKCGHRCSGTCGECLQGRLHKRCSEKCGVPLICSHECRFPCREACRPCDKKCTFRCVHSACGRKCGDICIPCREPCQRRCKHRKCTRVCSAICNVPPCMEPCAKLLECNHKCIGFCGEPCPPKCLVCDREELLESEMLFGYENEDSRFVLLADCKHILESDGMEQWLKMQTVDGSTAIGAKVCPKCKTPIRTTLRYSDHTKRAIADVNEVKMKAVGSFRKINDTRGELMERVIKLQNRLKSSIWSPYITSLHDRLKPAYKRRRQDINMIQLTAIAAKLQIIEQLVDMMRNNDEINFCLEYQQEIQNCLARSIDLITNQEIRDVTNEMERLHRAFQYERMKRSPEFIHCFHKSDVETKQLSENIERVLYCIGSYTNDTELINWLQKLKKHLGVQQMLIDIERKQIVQAMGMSKGHWFKCPNGHIYAIGDCGGANQVSTCNECGAKIGGTSHSLLSNNTFAPEMDGARFAAYSEEANNLGNFHLNFI